MKKMDIVHQYFKKVVEKGMILVQVNPVSMEGLELIIHPNGEIDKTKRQFDELIYADLEEDDFQASSALEFNLYLKGLVK